jgi:hypothetical protein
MFRLLVAPKPPLDASSPPPPQALLLPPDSMGWLVPNYVNDRAALAHAAKKPIILEEFGQTREYSVPRDTLVRRHAHKWNKGSLVWLPNRNHVSYSACQT